MYVLLATILQRHGSKEVPNTGKRGRENMSPNGEGIRERHQTWQKGKKKHYVSSQSEKSASLETRREDQSQGDKV